MAVRSSRVYRPQRCPSHRTMAAEATAAAATSPLLLLDDDAELEAKLSAPYDDLVQRARAVALRNMEALQRSMGAASSPRTIAASVPAAITVSPLTTATAAATGPPTPHSPTLPRPQDQVQREKQELYEVYSRPGMPQPTPSSRVTNPVQLAREAALAAPPVSPQPPIIVVSPDAPLARSLRRPKVRLARRVTVAGFQWCTASRHGWVALRRRWCVVWTIP